MSDDVFVLPIGDGRSVKLDTDMAEVIAVTAWTAVWNPKTKSWYARRLRRPGEYEYSGEIKFIRMHRQVMAMHLGRKLSPLELVDHINHDTLDNRISNLRICTNSQNMCNRRVNRTSPMGLKGVYLHAGKWRAAIELNGQRWALGAYNSIHEAASAYDRAALSIHGDFAFTNYPSTAYGK